MQNLTGDGSVRASNYVYVNAPKDGAYIAAVNQNMPMYSIFGGEAAKFDAKKFQWLGSMASANTVVYTWHTSKVKTITDAKSIAVNLGGTGTNSDSYIFPTMLNELVGTKFKVINGYSGGRHDVQLAIERGEVEGRGGNSWDSIKSSNREWIDHSRLNPLVQIGFKREPDLMNVPLAQDLVDSDEKRQIVDIISLPTAIGYAHWVAPEAPPANVDALRVAYAKALDSIELRAEAEKIGMTMKPATGSDIEAMVKRASSAPEEVIRAAAKVLRWQE